VVDYSHCPKKIQFPGRELPPSPSNPCKNPKFCWKGQEASANSVHHRIFCTEHFRGAGPRSWILFTSQPSDDRSITSRVKSRSQKRSEVLRKVQESQISPLGCSPSVLDAALLAPPRLSLWTWSAYCRLPQVLLGVCAHNMPWEVVCPGARCKDAHALRTCTHNDVDMCI